MTDADPRLEAAIKAAEDEATKRGHNRVGPYEVVAIYDALRALEQASDTDPRRPNCRGVKVHLAWCPYGPRQPESEVMPHSEPRAQTRSEHNATAPVMGADPLQAWPDPTPEMQASPLFEAIWSVIKAWDIAVPKAYGGYCSATGNHVRAILDAINTQPPSEAEIKSAQRAVSALGGTHTMAGAALIAAAKARSGA